MATKRFDSGRDFVCFLAAQSERQHHVESLLKTQPNPAWRDAVYAATANDIVKSEAVRNHMRGVPAFGTDLDHFIELKAVVDLHNRIYGGEPWEEAFRILKEWKEMFNHQDFLKRAGLHVNSDKRNGTEMFVRGDGFSFHMCEETKVYIMENCEDILRALEARAEKLQPRAHGSLVFYVQWLMSKAQEPARPKRSFLAE